MRTYELTHKEVSSGTSVVTLLEFTAPSAKSCLLTRAWLAQKGSTTSAQQSIEITRKSAGGTNVTTPTIKPIDAGDSAFGGTVRGMCTTEGTLSDSLIADAFNWVNGWQWLSSPRDEIVIPGAGIIGMRLPTAPPSLTISCGLTLIEIG